MNVGLALCGGGMRGYIEACFLDLLVQKGLVSPRLTETFSVMGGTSTGGIQALGYGLGQSPRQARSFFELWGRKIFSNPHGKRLSPSQKALAFLEGRPFYPRDNLHQALQGVLGQQKMAALPHAHIFVTTFEEPNGCIQIDQRRQHLAVVEAALMTSAAPFYFGAYAHDPKTYDDGFIYCNNPALLVLQRLLSLGQPFALLSMGTGVKERISDPQEITHDNITRHYLKQSQLLSRMMTGQNTLVQEICKALCPKGRFLHLDISLEDIEDAGMDNAEASFLLTLARKCEEALEIFWPQLRVLFSPAS